MNFVRGHAIMSKLEGRAGIERVEAMTLDANGLTKGSGTEGSSGRADEALENDLRLLRLFNRYRHDWMNDIQIVFGYIKLKKYDKLLDLMGKINEKVRQESLVSKLGNPSLIVHLLTFQAEVKELQLTMTMDEEIRMEGEPEAEWIRYALARFREQALAHPEEPNALELAWHRTDAGITLSMRYAGGYDEPGLRELWRGAARDRRMLPEWICEEHYEAGAAAWVVQFPEAPAH